MSGFLAGSGHVGQGNLQNGSAAPAAEAVGEAPTATSASLPEVKGESQAHCDAGAKDQANGAVSPKRSLAFYVPEIPPFKGVRKKVVTFVDLPIETQRQILSYCSRNDLICLSLVSHRFRGLAAAELYRNFRVIFTSDDDAVSHDLAGAFETFVTSDYDYATHLNDISLDTLTTGDKAEPAYKPYLYSVNGGRFMNTLLLMTLRKAKNLESFRWNIRVELSRPVYQALHKIRSLKNLQIRMQAGPSLFEAPPPLPLTPQAATPSPPPPVSIIPPHYPGGLFPGPAATTTTTPAIAAATAPWSWSFYPVSSSTVSQSSASSSKPAARSKLTTSKKANVTAEPPTLSGFSNLRRIAILDIDNLDIIPELQQCVRNSAATVTSMELSFSESLALQSRKPPPEVDPDESEVEDEFQVPPPASSGMSMNDDTSGPAKTLRAQEEKKNQESVLGRIFDVSPHTATNATTKTSKNTSSAELDQEGSQAKGKDADAKLLAPDRHPGEDFLKAIMSVSKKLTDVQQPVDMSALLREILATIEAAASKFVVEETARAAALGYKVKAVDPTIMQSYQAKQAEEAAAEKLNTAKPAAYATEPGVSGSSSAAALDSAKPAGKSRPTDDVTPEDIDVEAPEGHLVLDSLDPDGDDHNGDDEDETEAVADDDVIGAQSGSMPDGSRSLPPRPASAANVARISSEPLLIPPPPTRPYTGPTNPVTPQILRAWNEAVANFNRDESILAELIAHIRNFGPSLSVDELSEVDKRLCEIRASTHDAWRAVQRIEQQLVVLEGERAASSPQHDNQHQHITEYQRATRGLPLRSLSIYLIPMKPSVLSRAVELRHLHQLTLLNVGPQASLWNLLAKENKESSLALRSVTTDNVTIHFLNFLSDLDGLHELYMLERDAKYKPESFAPRTTIKIDLIRRLVLMRHMAKLRRLMIKNDMDSSWDLDEKSTMLICLRGKGLCELSCSMGIKAMHVFMQQISGLYELRALHVVHLRNDDVCVWVLRETKRFLVDNLAHYPRLKLQWVAINEDRVDRLVRATVKSSLKGKLMSHKARGKKKEPAGIDNSNSLAVAASAIFLASHAPFNAAASTSSSTNYGPGSDVDDPVSDANDDLFFTVQRVKQEENLPFSEAAAAGIRIFSKEVVVGRL